MPVCGRGIDGSSGRFSVRSWESESPTFVAVAVDIAVVEVVFVAVVAVDFPLEDVPRKSVSGSGSAATEALREPRGLCLVDPPAVEVLLVRRERARRSLPKSDVDEVASMLTPSAAWPPPPPSMTVRDPAVVANSRHGCF